MPTGCPGRRSAHLPYRLPLQVPGGAYANLEAYRIARYRQSLRNETVREQGADAEVPPYRTPVYVRLVDGGVADNSGLIALRRALSTVGEAANIARLAAQGKLRRLVVIVVNARSDPPEQTRHLAAIHDHSHYGERDQRRAGRQRIIELGSRLRQFHRAADD